MCGIAGCVDLQGRGRIERDTLAAMAAVLAHRGPDAAGCHVEPDVGLGFRRLRIVDLAPAGDQPLYNEDRSLALICNGEIFNEPELRREMLAKGHTFRSHTDVEVLLHLYEEHGVDLLDRLNGQFAFALWDGRRKRMLLARDHFGVNPLYFTTVDGLFLFASEVKALFQHPAVPRGVDLVGLDQILSLPGLVSPRTLFAGIESLEPGHCLLVEDGRVTRRQYWDLEYPEGAEGDGGSEESHLEALADALRTSVRRRLRADVPVGVFLSGGLDSSLVAALAVEAAPEAAGRSFSIAFQDAEIDESRFQRLMAKRLGTCHHEIPFDDSEISTRLRAMVYHCESPVKETFNTCALALAEAVHAAGVTVVLAGEGSDELFGGYPGYRFDAFGRGGGGQPGDELEEALEEELRERVWGDRRIFYEKDQVVFRDTKKALYGPRVRERFRAVDCMEHPLVSHARLRKRHPLHQRSYLDFKLRLADHLLSEHGDRMVMAHSVEARYPFLDLEVIEVARRMPPDLKIKGFVEKYPVKRMAEAVLPRSIVDREKFGFRAPGSPLLLQSGCEWAHDLLSPDLIRRRGVFDPDLVESLRRAWSVPGFRLHPHLETDLLMVVLTFNLLCELFDLPAL
jgi:asparagine synthase (glutamine-hydrolysing)